MLSCFNERLVQTAQLYWTDTDSLQHSCTGLIQTAYSTARLDWYRRSRRAWAGVMWFWSGGRMTGCCVHGNELPGSVKCGEFLDWLRTCWLLKKDSAPGSEWGGKEGGVVWGGIWHVCRHWGTRVQANILHWYNDNETENPSLLPAKFVMRTWWRIVSTAVVLLAAGIAQ